ncbi:hypothetical protein IWQ49_006408 [Labrenzia sp. EL_126]|nr:hypothetical protein [Labrenzia sp. EL_126]
MAAIKHEVETEFINLWAETDYDLVVNATVSSSMRRQGLDLLDVNFVMKTGMVINSDMRDSRGLWCVRGETVDDVELDLTVLVESSNYQVELLRVVKVIRSTA